MECTDVLSTDTFTDSAISSKCNSNHTEADMKVLQPWEGGEGEELGGLERESSVSSTHALQYCPVCKLR